MSRPVRSADYPLASVDANRWGRNCASAESDEMALVWRCQAGDVAAFEILYRREAPAALRVARLMLSDWKLAEDCLQEATLRAWSAIGRFVPGLPFRPWFRKFVVNEALRANRRRPRHVDPLDSVAEVLFAPDDADPGQEVGLRDAVAAAVAGLDPTHRAVVVLFYYEDLPEQEIAEILGVRVTTVKSRLHTARRRLDARLRREGFGNGL